MRSTEPLVAPDSFYFLHTPGPVAEKMFFYPTVLGRFSYLPGYELSRSRFDSFLFLFVESGKLFLRTEEAENTAGAGDVVLLDCYAPHTYGTKAGCDTLWFHFDGVLARPYFMQLTGQNGPVFHPNRPRFIRTELAELLSFFSAAKSVSEDMLSFRVTTLLHALFPEEKQEPLKNESGIRKVTAFIDAHFAEPLSLTELAALSGFSPYHFTRLFQKETGLTPHQYVIESRLSFAKYELSSTDRPVAEIAERSGFIDASAFCLTFKKHEGMTPGAYRKTAYRRDSGDRQ